MGQKIRNGSFSFSLTLSAFLLMLWIVFTCLAANIVHHATKHPHEARAEKLMEERWIFTDAKENSTSTWLSGNVSVMIDMT